MRGIVFAILALGACAHDVQGPQNILQLHQTADWQHAPGETVATMMDRDVARIGRNVGRLALIEQLQAAGYECQYGEAHEDYPERMAVCTRSFATRACQFDWEVSMTSNPARPGRIDTSETAFRRDCVDEADDWPVPVDSAIGDQLAPDAIPG